MVDWIVVVGAVVLTLWCEGVAAQGACSAGCVWSCDTRTNTCASPIGKKVCIGVTDLNKRSTPGTGTAAIGAWGMGDQPTVKAGPTQADGYFWFQLDSVWSAFSSTNGVFWYQVCPGTPPFVPPTTTVRPTAPPTVPTTAGPSTTTTTLKITTTGAPISQPSNSVLTTNVVGDQCNPSFDKCCTAEGLIAPAGTLCQVKSGQCILENSACDGRASTCPVVGAPDGQKCTTSVGQDGTCQSSICQQAVSSCSPAATMFLNTCKSECSKMSKTMKELCMCKESGQTSAVCWPTARVEEFASGSGADVAQFQSTCPEFCVCSCMNPDGPNSPSDAASLAATVATVAALLVAAL